MTTLLAIAAWMLGLSLLVQVVQEAWKYLTNSKALAFEAALSDLLGTSLVKRLQQDRRLAVRGPLQFRRVSRAGYVLPASQQELLFALENTASRWHLGLLRALQQQASLPGDTAAAPTLHLRNMLAEVFASASPQVPSAQELADFLKAVGVQPGATQIDAVRVLNEFWNRFFGHLQPLTEHYAQMIRNFEFSYQRRNTKQSFNIGLVLAVLLNLPFQSVYQRAAAATPAEAMKLAADAQAAYASAQESDKPDLDRLRQLANESLNVACGPGTAATDPQVAQCLEVDFISGMGTRQLLKGNDGYFAWFVRAGRYLFGCLLTALLVSFGAPFWNDLLSSMSKQTKPTTNNRID